MPDVADRVQTPATEPTDPRAEEKADLLAQLSILDARKKAVERLIEDRKAKLYLLMKQDGDLKRQTPEATATRSSRRKFVIFDRSRLAELFPAAVLLEQVKVDAAFYDAAKKAKVSIDDAVTVESDESFKVEPRRSAAAKERQERIIEETKAEMASRVAALARRMRGLDA